MALNGKLVSKTAIKSDGDVFHEILRDKPHQLQEMSPIIHGVDLHEGEWGVVGSIITWEYTHDGKTETLKDVVETIDEATKTVQFKVIEGHLMELYKSFYINVHVDTKGEDNVVTLTLTYEKVNENVEDPHTYMEFLVNVVKHMETHHLESVDQTKTLRGKLVSKTAIKSDGDVFHEILRDRPHQLQEMSPIIHGVDLHEGEWGVVGSIITWEYTHDGKTETLKDVVESIDEENKTVRFKVIEGHLMELYKSFYINVHVDTKGEDNVVTLTLTYEKVNDKVEDPHTYMEFLVNVVKHMETHHLESAK